MSAVFVTGAGTDIGKTHIACALLRAWRRAGAPCDAFKPLLSGYDQARLAESDAGRLLAALGKAVNAETVAAMSPWRYAAPLAPPAAARREGLRVPYDEIVAACQARIAAAKGVLLIEGAGGVMSPIADGQTNLDLIAALGAPALLVGGTYLGAISHALTALEALHARGARVAAVVVSESAAGAESLADTIASLCQFHDGPVLGAPRFVDTAPPTGINALADLIVAR